MGRELGAILDEALDRMERRVEWMRRRYPEEKAGTRPFLMVLDFVQIASGLSHDETREMMVRTAHEAHPGGQGLRLRGAPGVDDGSARRAPTATSPSASTAIAGSPPGWAGGTPPGW